MSGQGSDTGKIQDFHENNHPTQSKREESPRRRAERMEEAAKNPDAQNARGRTLEGMLSTIEKNAFLHENEDNQAMKKEIESWGKIKQLWETNEDKSELGWGGSMSKDTNTNWDEPINQYDESLKPEYFIADTVNYSEVFKDIHKKTFKEIVDLVPKKARSRDTFNVYSPKPLEGVEFQWYDANDVSWKVRLHEGTNASTYWDVRIMRDDQYMDPDGNFHDRVIADPVSPKYEPHIGTLTHIKIEPPDPYISPLQHPEHYDRERISWNS